MSLLLSLPRCHRFCMRSVDSSQDSRHPLLQTNAILDLCVASARSLSSFLSALPPTTPDNGVVLPDSGRCELAVRQRFVGRSDPGVAALDQESLRLLPQPLRHSAMMRTGPLARAAEAECPVPAVGCSPRGRLAIRSPRGRWDRLALGIDVAAPL